MRYIVMAGLLFACTGCAGGGAPEQEKATRKPRIAKVVPLEKPGVPLNTFSKCGDTKYCD